MDRLLKSGNKNVNVQSNAEQALEEEDLLSFPTNLVTFIGIIYFIFIVLYRCLRLVISALLIFPQGRWPGKRKEYLKVEQG